MLLPLGVSYDAAAASSDCDLLVDTLNEKRKRGDATDPDAEHAIGRVEQILMNFFSGALEASGQCWRH
eukprot:COSAG04_NODE_882_length_9663_cov_8.381639_2_plen_68_part_00